MAFSTNNITLLLNQQDPNLSNILNRTIGAISFGATVGQFREGSFPSTSLLAQTLPITTVANFYFKNLDTTAVVTVTWTPSGGSSNIVKAVGPGAILVFWETSNTSGITALSYQSTVSGSKFEDFMGG